MEASLLTKIIDGSFGPWMARQNTPLSNTQFFLSSKWLFKASIVALYVAPMSSKWMKMSVTSGPGHGSSN